MNVRSQLFECLPLLIVSPCHRVELISHLQLVVCMFSPFLLFVTPEFCHFIRKFIPLIDDGTQSLLKVEDCLFVQLSDLVVSFFV